MNDKQDKKPKEVKEKYNQSETVVINRSVIHFAPYNPRKKDPKIIAKLKKNFKEVGFLGGIVWNELSGNLVSGHKRVETLNLIHGHDGSTEKDYKIKVEKVQLDQKQEREQNIFMNAKSAQGEFDMDVLASILDDIDYQSAGLTDSDLTLIMAQTNYEFANNSTIENVISDMESIEKPYDDRKAAIKLAKQQQKEKTEQHFEEGETYFIVSFDNVDNKVFFLERFGFSPDDKYVKGELLEQRAERTK
jgi:hemerythrin superfamily protein